MMTMQNSSRVGAADLQRDARGWCLPTDHYLRLFLRRPELAPVPESCPAERALHAALMVAPARAVGDHYYFRLRSGSYVGRNLGYFSRNCHGGKRHDFHEAVFKRRHWIYYWNCLCCTSIGRDNFGVGLWSWPYRNCCAVKVFAWLMPRKLIVPNN